MVRFVVAMGLTLLALAARAQVLTLEAARERALAQQPALKALELNAEALAEAAPAERALPDPRVKFGLLNLPTRNFPGQSWEEMTQLVVSYEQMLPGGDKRRLRERRALAEAEQMKAETAGQRQMIRREVGMAWVEAWQAVAAERAVRELDAEFVRSQELAEIALASGRGPQAEVFALRQMRSMVADRVLELSTMAEKARASLRRWVPDAGRFELPAELPRWREPKPIDRLAEAIDRHPQHAPHLLAQKTADAEVALAREAAVPDKSVELGYGFRAGQNRSDMLMLQIAFELPAWRGQKQDRIVASKLRLAERAREQRDDHFRQLRADLDAAHAEWRLAGERLANLDRSVTPAVRGRLETLLAAQASGRAELAQLLDVRRQLIEIRLQEIALLGARARARVGIEYFEHAGEGQ